MGKTWPQAAKRHRTTRAKHKYPSCSYVYSRTFARSVNRFYSFLFYYSLQVFEQEIQEEKINMRKAIIIIVLVLLSFLFSALFLKAISGEDCWMPDGKGGWVKHGVPAGPVPDYPSPIADTSTLIPLWWLLCGSLLSGLSIYLYLRFSKAKPKSTK